MRGFIIFVVAIAFVVVVMASTMGGGDNTTSTGSSGATHTMSDGTKMNGNGMDAGDDGR